MYKSKKYDPGQEADVDCGGICNQGCGEGKQCIQDQDCGYVNGVPLSCCKNVCVLTSVTTSLGELASNYYPLPTDIHSRVKNGKKSKTFI